MNSDNADEYETIVKTGSLHKTSYDHQKRLDVNHKVAKMMANRKPNRSKPANYLTTETDQKPFEEAVAEIETVETRNPPPITFKSKNK